MCSNDLPIEPDEWSLRIHGMVERELVLSYSDLVERRMTESWITLNCVSNEVGGGYVGCATALTLAERGVSVALCEKGVVAGEASGRSTGIIDAMSTSDSRKTLPLTAPGTTFQSGVRHFAVARITNHTVTPMNGKLSAYFV